MTALDVIAGQPWAVRTGDSLDLLRILPDGCVHCCVTSPPYFALRSYLPKDSPLKPQEMGLEALHDCLGWASGQCCGACYVCRMTTLFREVRRVLHPSGTLWLNMGDSFAGGGGGNYTKGTRNTSGQNVTNVRNRPDWLEQNHVKAKDLLMVPAALAMSLRADGWHLRSEITLAKLAPMPESVTDRPTRACEKLYLLTKGPRYFYDQEAERVGLQDSSVTRSKSTPRQHPLGWHTNAVPISGGDNPITDLNPDGRNLWDWWSGEGLEEEADDLPEPFWAWHPEPSRVKHYAAYPSWLPRRCIRLGTSVKGVCPHCAAPWVRVVERKRHERSGDVRASERDGGLTAEDGLERTGLSHFKYNEWLKANPPQTTGWAPTCRCPDHAPVPALVLDPFTGSGVTGIVARGQGRRFLGMELNPEYADLARKRIALANPLLDHCDRMPRKRISAETPSLFA